MIKKNIFYRKKSNNNLYFFIIFLFLLIIIFVFIFYSKNKFQYFIIDDNNKNFYSIPKDKKGKKIANIDIKILDYNYNLNKKTDKNYTNIDFSIQLYSSSNYDNIIKKYIEYKNNLSFYTEDLFVVSLKHNLGIDYLLVYRNFMNRKKALDYCTKFLDLIENCLIVNINNLD